MTLAFYSNERVFLDNGRFLARSRAFSDFGVALCAAMDGASFLAAPARPLTEDDVATEDLAELPIDAARFLPLPFARNRYESFLHAVQSARRILGRARTTGDAGASLIVAGPSTNSVSFFLSTLLPPRARMAYFMRGDTVATLSAIFENRMARPAIVGYARALRRNERRLHRTGRAEIFPYGAELAKKFDGAQRPVFHVAPILDPSWLDTPCGQRPQSPTTRLIFCGRLSAEKNVASLLEALAQLVAKGKNVTLKIIGAGPEQGQLTQNAAKLGLSDLVSFRGHIGSPETLMSEFDNHDVLCLPSLTEGTPRVVSEALARGLTVVATPVGSIPNMAPGVVQCSQSTDMQSFYDTLERVVGDPVLRDDLKDQGVRSAEQFLVPRQAQYVAGILREIAARGGK